MPGPVGLIVNPIAGMGGSVGLHGTDGAAILAEARARGALPRAAERTRRALARLAETSPGTPLLAAPGPLGAEAARGLALDLAVLPGSVTETTAADSIAAARRLVAAGAALILFAGGDGTARDLAGVAGLATPLLGIPCGVKMQSGVFATSPEAAGRLAADLVGPAAARIGFRRVEIMDIDEEARRAGRLVARLFGYARAPYARSLLQGAKAAPPLSDEAALEAACVEAARELAPGVTWLIGPGTTAERVLAALGACGTLLGVDAWRDGRLVGRDLAEREALALAGDGPLGIVVGVTGGQGFVFGRGNQQLGPEAIRRASPDRLIVLAGEAKLRALPEPRLLVDTGDPALDAALAGWTRVRTGPRRATMMRLTA